MGASQADLPIRPGTVIPGADLEVRTSRSSGPGGQNVNKVETAVELRVDLARCGGLAPAARERLLAALAPRLASGSVLSVRRQRHRSQGRNLEDARTSMAELLATHLEPPKTRKATRPTRGSQRRRLDAKRQRSDRKRDRGRNWE